MYIYFTYFRESEIDVELYVLPRAYFIVDIVRLVSFGIMKLKESCCCLMGVDNLPAIGSLKCFVFQFGEDSTFSFLSTPTNGAVLEVSDFGGAIHQIQNLRMEAAELKIHLDHPRTLMIVPVRLRL